MRKAKYFLSGVLIVCLVAAIFPISVVGASGVPVAVVVPAQACPGTVFVARVTIGNVAGFDAAQFDVTFDPGVLAVVGAEGGAEGVTNGNIGGTVVPVAMWGYIPPHTPGAGRIRVLCNMPGITGVSGSGYLADIHLQVVGPLGSSSPIGLSNGLLGDFNALKIEADWFGSSVEIDYAPWDVNEDCCINVLDVILIGQHFGETGPPCWIREDVNCDGVVNVLDVILVGQHFGEGICP